MRIDQVSVAFVGVPVDTNDDPRAPNGNQKIWYRFVIEEPLRGLPDDAREIIVDPASGSSCQKRFELGEKYLLVAYGQHLPRSTAAMRNITLMTGECTGTRLAEYAAEDISYLRQMAKDPPPAGIFGLVQLHGNEKFSRLSYPPVAGAEVQIAGAAIERSTHTDGEGRYEFTDVAAGEYVLSAKAEGLQSLHRTYLLQVKPHGCGSANIGLYANGAISGRVIDQGANPVAGARVVYLPANEQTPRADFDGSRTITDEQGRYRFSRVAPGDYRIGVEIDRPPVWRREVIPTFWPRVERGGQAPAIHLALNETKADLTVPVRLTTTRTIHVRVVFPDGHPVEKAQVSASADKDDFDARVTDGNGVAAFQVLQGLSYVFSASFASRDDGSDEMAPAVQLFTCEPTAPPKGNDWHEVTLVLTEDASLQ